MNLNKKPITAVAAILSLSLASDSFADVIKEMVDGGKASLNVRTRYEYVDGQADVSDTNGYGIRTRLGLTSGEVGGFKAMLELEDLSFADPGDRPVLDVPTTEINQLWVSYGNDSISSKLGNQVFTLDDHRFIGHVGWRQNIQTFDAATLKIRPSSGLPITMAYLWRVNRVNATSQDLEGVVLNGGYAFGSGLDVTGFAYLLDFENPAWSTMDTNTYGVRGTGKFGGDESESGYVFGYAQQTDAGSNMVDVDLGHVEASIYGNLGKVKLTVGYESMEGDGSRGFTTPLATVHKFNGFADVFAGRSMGLAGGLPHGLEDLYISADYKVSIGNGVPLAFGYHRFSAERVSEKLGEEFDFVAKYRLNEYTLLLAKYAYYEASAGNTVGYGGEDASMFSLEANFNF